MDVVDVEDGPWRRTVRMLHGQQQLLLVEANMELARDAI
jgi:hypothetical protein